MTSAIGRPMTPFRRWPKVRSAAGLNSMMRPSWSIVTMQSIAESRIAVLRASVCLSAASLCARSMAMLAMWVNREIRSCSSGVGLPGWR